MATLLQASNLTLHDVKQKFNLRRVSDGQFFPEWQEPLPTITDWQKTWLDQVQADFLGLAEYPLHEKVTKLFVVAPLLSLAGLGRLPFLPVAEKQVEVSLGDLDELIRGRIDVLILQQSLWVALIETKPERADVMQALPQALFYMMTAPDTDRDAFALLANGYHFVFVKLSRQDSPQYALSRVFSLVNPGNDLYAVLQILQRLGELVSRRDSVALNGHSTLN
jgi:hypothetical protein